MKLCAAQSDSDQPRWRWTCRACGWHFVSVCSQARVEEALSRKVWCQDCRSVLGPPTDDDEPEFWDMA